MQQQLVIILALGSIGQDVQVGEERLLFANLKCGTAGHWASTAVGRRREALDQDRSLADHGPHEQVGKRVSEHRPPQRMVRHVDRGGVRVQDCGQDEIGLCCVIEGRQQGAVSPRTGPACAGSRWLGRTLPT